jgi:hypothetical protein
MDRMMATPIRRSPLGASVFAGVDLVRDSWFGFLAVVFFSSASTMRCLGGVTQCGLDGGRVMFDK